VARRPENIEESRVAQKPKNSERVFTNLKNEPFRKRSTSSCVTFHRASLFLFSFMNNLIAKRDIARACGQIIGGLGAVGVMAELTARGADISGSHAEQIDRLLDLRAQQLSTILPTGSLIANLRVPELKAELATRNAPTHGLKQARSCCSPFGSPSDGTLSAQPCSSSAQPFSYSTTGK
jgi:hypothetical protein